jgi:hypothetical protein
MRWARISDNGNSSHARSPHLNRRFAFNRTRGEHTITSGWRTLVILGEFSSAPEDGCATEAGHQKLNAQDPEIEQALRFLENANRRR